MKVIEHQVDPFQSTNHSTKIHIIMITFPQTERKIHKRMMVGWFEPEQRKRNKRLCDHYLVNVKIMTIIFITILFPSAIPAFKLTLI